MTIKVFKKQNKTEENLNIRVVEKISDLDKVSDQTGQKIITNNKPIKQ